MSVYPYDIVIMTYAVARTLKTIMGCLSVVARYWMIRGQKMEFSRVKPAKGEEDATAYQTTWDSSEMGVTKRGARDTLPIELEVRWPVSTLPLGIVVISTHRAGYGRSWGGLV